MYNLYIKQKVFKITDHYEVFNENSKPVYQVDQDFKLIGNTIKVKKLDGSKSFVINREIFTLLPVYNVNFSDGKEFQIKKNFTFFKKSIDVISSDYELNLSGNFWDLNFDVSDGGRHVGSIKKEFLSWGDTFTISVYDETYEEELLALLIAVDDILDQEANARNR